MIGYKAFDKDLKCRGIQFEVGKTYNTGRKKEELELCSNTVFHFCREISKIEFVSEYKLEKSRICEVIATGDIVTDGEKYGTNEIMILREVPQDEWKSWSISNVGANCTGKYNVGADNLGSWNTGGNNLGNCNTGGNNSGSWNTGGNNLGSYNTGNYNSGHGNSGHRNSGNYNSGDYNSGDYNSGSWNKGSRNCGCFNTTAPKLRFFNKETDVSLEEIDFPDFLMNVSPGYFIYKANATDEEKEIFKKEIEIAGGFLRRVTYEEAFENAWNTSSLEDHKKLLKLPNWNNEIFKEISGIDAEAKIAEEEKEKSQ